MELYFAAKFWGNVILLGLLIVISLTLIVIGLIDTRKRRGKK